MQPGLGGPGRDVEYVGRLGQGQADVEMKDKNGALIDWKAAERSVDLVTIRDREGHVGFTDRLEVGHHVQLDQIPAAHLA